MAEKQLAYRASGKDEFFADDDPLAELARIVGFEPRTAAPAASAPQRQEPAFDLEDELLREFERYDAPRLTPVDDIPLSPENEPFGGEADYSQPGNSNDPHFEHPSRSEPEFAELPPEPEVQAEVYEDTTTDWQAQARTIVESWSRRPDEPQLHDSSVSEAPAASAASEAAAPTAEARDLADELELSIADAPAMPPAPTARTPQWAAASIRLPLANFNAPRREEPAQEEVKRPEPAPSMAAVPAVEPTNISVAEEGDAHLSPALGFPSEQDRHEEPSSRAGASAELAAVSPREQEEAAAGFDLLEAARNGVQSDVALTEPPYTEEAGPSLDIDDLLADVSRYPVPQRGAPTGAAAKPDVVEPPLEPAMAAPEPVIAAPPSQPMREEPKPAAAEADDPFADQDFELDLEGIELELADFDFTEPKNIESAPVETPLAIAPQPAAKATPLAPSPQVSPSVSATTFPAAPIRSVQTPRPELAARPVTAPILRAPPPPAAPVSAVAARAAPQEAIDADQALPFDPSEISDTDERIETFEGMHVPTLPPVEQEEPVVMPPEYDFDIDAEMASLFGTPSKDSAPQPAKATANEAVAANWARTAPSARDMTSTKHEDQLDEFERALEEDFRRSVRESSHPAENVTRMTLEAASVTADRRRARSMRGLAVAAAAIVVVGAGAYGVYGWLFHGAPLGLSSGEPRVITADKEPVKVVPENPGGKVVPNQDKAVYDRVAGDAAPAPKQKELVSSNEQPVDVVQKTLIPEAVSPDDNDGGDAPVTSTPVGETEDPRLLPNQGANTDTAANDQDNVPTVSPRKVRTMIVKPDGTLVAREETAPAADDTVKTAASPAKLAPANAPTGNGLASTGASASTLANTADDNAASAESTPIRVVKTTKVADAGATGTAAPAATPPGATTPAAAAPVEDIAAANSPAPDVAPVPTARPVQPAKVADHSSARPAQTQVASASPATQPVQAAPAASAGAGGYVMQIASLPSEDEAKKSQANLSAKFASVIGGHPMEIRKFDIPGKGTYYRVRVVAGSKDDAAALCVRYRQAGGSCLISK